MKQVILLLLWMASLWAGGVEAFKRVNVVTDRIGLVAQDGTVIEVAQDENVTLNLRDFENTGKSIAARFRTVHGDFKAMHLYVHRLFMQTDENATEVPLRLDGRYILVEGNFSIKPVEFVTQELAYNLNADITQDAHGNFLYTPHIRVIGSRTLYGIFYKIDHRRGLESLTMRLKPEGKVDAIIQEHPEVLVVGDYDYDKQAKTITLDPQKLSCPDCNIFKKALMKVIPKPKPFVYDVIDVSPDLIVIFELKKYYVDLHRTQEFKIFYRPE